MFALNMYIGRVSLSYFLLLGLNAFESVESLSLDNVCAWRGLDFCFFLGTFVV
jgi:hypothetical protein